MSYHHCAALGRSQTAAALAILAALTAASAKAQPARSTGGGAAVAVEARPESATLGRIEFDFPQAPPATLEVELNQGILMDLAGISEAAMAGIAEALLEGGEGHTAATVQRSAQHIAAVRQVVRTLGSVVRELRVRVYDNLPESAQEIAGRMAAHYHEKLREANWDNVIRFREGNDSVTISLVRGDGAIRGLFIIVADGNDLVIANAVCDLTPEKVKQVTNQLTKIGMEFGLGRVIDQVIQEVEREF